MSIFQRVVVKEEGNRPDAKLLLQDKNLNFYPILIEYKGYKDKLVKLDANGQVDNRTAKNEPILKNINAYAVNGAVHYANALLHYTSYTDIISIGMTGYKDENGNVQYSIGVYYVSKSNFGVGQKVDEYTDLSFLKKENFDAFIEKVKNLQLSQDEIDKVAKATVMGNWSEVDKNLYTHKNSAQSKARIAELKTKYKDDYDNFIDKSYGNKTMK